MYLLYVARATEFFGVTRTREIYAKAIAALPDRREEFRADSSVRTFAYGIALKVGGTRVIRRAFRDDCVMRVSFKDYGFFVPTDISGKRVEFTGEVVAREMTAEEAEHYAEDLGTEEPPVEPGMVYEIVATAVRVPRG